MIEDCEEVLEDVKTNDENLKKPTAENIAKGLFIAAGEFIIFWSPSGFRQNKNSPK
jgi:hypothetical protein